MIEETSNPSPEASSQITPEPTAPDMIRKYFVTLWQVMTHPTSFFRTMPTEGGMTGPLAFALVTHWLGSALSFLWRTWMGNQLAVYFDTFSRIAGDVADHQGDGSPLPWNQILAFKNQFLNQSFFKWFWGVGSIVIDPFYTLISILFTSFFVFVGAKVFVTWIPPEEHKNQPHSVSFESAVRLICYGMSPMILAGIPLFGWGLATFLSAIVTIIGAKEIYKVGTFRAIVIALFPKLLFLGFILAGVLVLFTLFIKLLSSVF